MTVGISNNFTMNIENETIYHTGDVMRIFDRVIECTPEASNKYYRILGQDDIDVFRINYPSYGGQEARSSWSDHRSTLSVSIPRLSKLKSQPSSLASLAAASDGFDDVSDDDYIYFACGNMISNVANAMSETMNRTGAIDTSGLRLRYCDRLTKKRKAAQRLHILNHERSYLKIASNRIRALEACYEQDIESVRNQVSADLARK